MNLVHASINARFLHIFPRPGWDTQFMIIPSVFGTQPKNQCLIHPSYKFRPTESLNARAAVALALQSIAGSLSRSYLHRYVKVPVLKKYSAQFHILSYLVVQPVRDVEAGFRLLRVDWKDIQAGRC
jgi:hypothetical protein